MSIRRKVLIIALPILLTAVIIITAIILFVNSKTYKIEKNYFIDLPHETQVVSYQDKIHGINVGQLIIPETDLKDFIDSVKDAGYRTKKEIILDTGFLTDISLPDTEKLQDYECYLRRFGDAYSYSIIEYYIYFGKPKDEFITIYLYKC